MAESSSKAKRVLALTEEWMIREKRENPFCSRQKGDNFDDVFGCVRLTPEKRKKFFGEEFSDEDKKVEEERKKMKMSQIPTEPLPVYNFCLTPVSEEQQKQKGLHTVKSETPPSYDDFKPLFSPFAADDDNLFASKGENLFAARALRPLTPAEETRFHNMFGPPPPTLLLHQPERLFEQLPTPQRCTTGEFLSPYCKCSEEELASRCSPRFSRIETLSVLPHGALEEHRPHFFPIWLAYKLQTRQSHYFDIDDLPGPGTGVTPLQPSVDFNSEDGVPLELANLAIKEYNEKESNVYKYKVLKIEKVNHSVVGCVTIKYWMTVKVLNLTLATPIETFQIHAGIRMCTGEKTIFCCRPKEEVNVGLPCCDVCFGKLDT